MGMAPLADIWRKLGAGPHWLSGGRMTSGPTMPSMTAHEIHARYCCCKNGLDGMSRETVSEEAEARVLRSHYPVVMFSDPAAA